MKECTTHHNACDCREELILKVINDLMRAPKGIVPDSVYELYPGFVSDDEIKYEIRW